MDIGVEISLYPLQQEYLAPIRDFIRQLGADGRLRVVTNSMSTQLYGEYELVMQTLSRELLRALTGTHKTVVIMKIIGPLGD